MLKMRKIIVLILLGICAYTDIKERNIYIVPLYVCTIISVGLSIFQMLICNDVGCLSKYVRELMVDCGIGMVIVTGAYISQGRIGTGDGYLVASVGMIMGADFMLGWIIIVSILSFILCAGIIVRSKIGSSIYIEAVPMAPVMLLGYIVEIFVVA